MKRIKMMDYNPSMGPLIDVRKPADYNLNPTKNSINIYVDNLLINHKTYLNKDKTYYITCTKGFLSKRAVSTLEFFGYDVVQVIN